MVQLPEQTVSRAMWEAVERFHGLTYTAPEVREQGTAAGLKGFWMNYFATRIAPVGPVGADIVASTFFYYGPARVNRAIPRRLGVLIPGCSHRSTLPGDGPCAAINL